MKHGLLFQGTELNEIAVIHPKLDWRQPTHRPYFDLLKHIDQGEYSFMQDTLINEPNKILFIKGLEFSNHKGIVTAMLHQETLRIQTAFEQDITDELALSTLISIVFKGINAYPHLPVVFWMSHRNTRICQTFLATFYPQTSIYKSHEFTFDYKARLTESIEPLYAKRFTESDLLPVLHLLEESFQEIASKNTFISQPKKYLDLFSQTQNALTLLYYRDQTLVGMFSHDHGDIAYFAVAVNEQRKGIGKKIIHHALREIKPQVTVNPYLYCVDENTKAIAFYHKAGFKLTARALNFRIEKKG